MIPLFKTSQIRELDDYAINRLGIPGSILMENASLGIVEAINANFNLDENHFTFGIICGKGNNGGDGFAVARHLSNLNQIVRILYLGSDDEMSDDCRFNYNVVKKISAIRKNISIKKYSSQKDLRLLTGSDIIIDAVLGTGVAGKLKFPYVEIIKYLNNIKAHRIAIDIPTGLNADTGYGDLIFRAECTITLGDYKRGLFINNGAEYCGKVVLKEIGVGRDYLEKFSVQDYLIEPEDIFEILPKKRKSLHKYSAGKVFIIAGSGKYPGAAVLTSRAAFNSGAGSVILAFPMASRKLIQKNLTEIVFEEYDSDKNILTKEAAKSFNEKINWADVIALGPGLDRDSDTSEAVKQILRVRKNKFIVLDADGIYAISKGAYKKFNLKSSVLTPHLGEFSYLIDIPVEKIKQDLLGYGRAFSVQTESYLVLKGAPTIIFTPDGDALINTTGNPGMAKFGTGDVLTGMISSFISQTKNIESGVLLGVYLHSLSADLLLTRKTEFSITASDIIKSIPHAIAFIRKSF